MRFGLLSIIIGFFLLFSSFDHFENKNIGASFNSKTDILLSDHYSKETSFFDGANLINPVNGATNVPVNTTITWREVPGIIGYFITLGTTPGGNDLVDMQATGSATSFTPPLGLPENTTIYVTITLFIPNQGNIDCREESFTTEDVTVPPVCTTLTTPVNGETNVSTDTNISWLFAPGATGYRISIGTTANGSEIINDLNVGNTLSFDPPADFPNATEIFVRITPFNENGDAQDCIEESFITGMLIVRPECTSLILPLNGAINVPLNTPVQWNPVPGAISYRVSIGLTPGGTEVLNNSNFETTSLPFIELEPNTIFFVTITPINMAGEAIGCISESFTTAMGCLFVDPITQEEVNLIPELEFPDTFALCLDNLPLNLSAPPGFDGYRWFMLLENSEVQIANTIDVDIIEEGNYRLEVFNNFNQFGTIVECSNSQDFTVSASEIATIVSIEVNSFTPDNNNTITVSVIGNGDYEYALNSIEGPYQSSNTFNNVSAGFNTVFVRDRNGCGIVQQEIVVVGFPNFFTPNGDGVNDFWQVFADNNPIFDNANIFIFDRFGKLLKQMNTLSEGWDGTFNGARLPSTDYWFKISLQDGNDFTGHFSLVR